MKTIFVFLLDWFVIKSCFLFSNSRGGKALVAQHMRLHVVTSKAAVHITLDPKVRPAPQPCPEFITGYPEPVQLSPSSYWILRFPYVYEDINRIKTTHFTKKVLAQHNMVIF